MPDPVPDTGGTAVNKTDKIILSSGSFLLVPKRQGYNTEHVR